jgi:hypothetical protein
MSDHVYVNDSLTLTLDTNTDISGAATFRIYYKKPDNTTGYWVATRSGTTLVYTAAPNIINKSGAWKVKAWVQYSGGATYQGDPAYFEVRRSWQVR